MILCGRIVFLMLLMRLGNQHKVKGHMESVWGFSRTIICRYTNYLQTWIWLKWCHVLIFNKDYVSRNLEYWAERIGSKMQYTDPSINRQVYPL